MNTTKDKAKSKHPHLKFLMALQQEILSQVGKMRAFDKPEVTGALFEELVREMLNDFLPANLRAVPGVIVGKSGERSSHFDCLIVDTRFPYLGTLGQNKFVMASALVGALELTVRLDKRKLGLVTKKAVEISKLNLTFPERSLGETIHFLTLVTDSYVSRDDIASALDKWSFGDIYLLRQKGSSFHYWLEKTGDRVDVVERETTTALSDLLLMMTQDHIGIMERRGLSADVSEAMNDAIEWGTVNIKRRPQSKPEVDGQ